MAEQNVFKRIEKKYQLSLEQCESFLKKAGNRICMDEYGLHTIHNIYYDTDNYRLIRNSLEKPKYKEKFRIRSYGEVNEDSRIFLEIKKKYKGIVYKRRLALPADQAKAYLEEGRKPEEQNQIFREIDYFIKFYHPVPRVYLAYDRRAYYGITDPGLRLTIDQNIRSRHEKLDLGYDGECQVLDPDSYLMEIKVPDAYPMWLVDLLCELKIYPVSFSKYGTVYSNSIRSGEITMHAVRPQISKNVKNERNETVTGNQRKEKEAICLQVF